MTCCPVVSFTFHFISNFFVRKKLCVAFMYWQFVFVFIGKKKWSKKLLLTCCWNWLQDVNTANNLDRKVKFAIGVFCKKKIHLLSLVKFSKKIKLSFTFEMLMKSTINWWTTAKRSNIFLFMTRQVFFEVFFLIHSSKFSKFLFFC